MIWEKGGKKGEDSRRREPPLFLSRISTIGRRTLSLSRCRFWCSHKRNPPPGAVVLWTSLLSSSSTLSAKTTKAARRTQSFSKKKKKRIGGGFFPVKCVFERDWKRNSFPKPTLRRFGGRKRVANVVVARHGPKVRRSLSLSLCVCVFLSSLCVRDRYLLVARGGRVILFLYLRLEKKKSPTKTQKTRRLIGWGKICTCALRALLPLVRFVLYTQTPNDD